MCPAVSVFRCICVPVDKLQRSLANVAYRAAREADFERVHLLGPLCSGDTDMDSLCHAAQLLAIHHAAQQPGNCPERNFSRLACDAQVAHQALVELLNSQDEWHQQSALQLMFSWATTASVEWNTLFRDDQVAALRTKHPALRLHPVQLNPHAAGQQPADLKEISMLQLPDSSTIVCETMWDLARISFCMLCAYVFNL